MHTISETGKKLDVKQVGERFFAWSPKALRWLPVSKSKVQF